MNVLIVESKRHLAELWRRALERLGAHVDIASSQDQAADMAAAATYHIVVLDLIPDEGSAFAVADFMNYRQPDAQVIFVTNTSFFSDGSIFQLFSNACAYVQSETAPDDLAAIIEHYAANRHTDSRP
jgi:DNA-binding NtrC family response regulator